MKYLWKCHKEVKVQNQIEVMKKSFESLECQKFFEWKIAIVESVKSKEKVLFGKDLVRL